MRGFLRALLAPCATAVERKINISDFRFQRVERSNEEMKSKGMLDSSCRCRETEQVDLSMELCSYIDEGHNIRRSRYATRSPHE